MTFATLSRRSFLAAAAGLLTSADSAEGRKRIMADFAVTELCPGCAYSGFAPTWQHVTRNKHGTFFSVITAQDNVNFAAQTLKVLWLKADGTLQEIFSRVFPSNPGAIESFPDTGELYLIYSDYLNGAIVVELWEDVTQSMTPQRTVFTGAGTANGKFTTTIDEAGRCIFLLGSAGYFFKIGQGGGEMFRQHMLQVGTAPSYFVLSLDEDGKLYAVWNTANVVGGLTNYDAIMAAMTPNPRNNPPTWFNGRWHNVAPVGSQLTLPIIADENGPAVWVVTGEQTANMSQLLVGAQICDGGKLPILYAQAPAAGERFFFFNNLKDCSMALDILPWSDVNARFNAQTHRPIRSASIMPRAASGGIFERESGLYVVAHDNAMNLVALRSEDGGKNWRDFARTTVPVGAGSHMLHYVSGFRGHEDDDDIKGIVVDEHTTPSAWATGANVPANAATVYRWSLPLPE